SYPETLRCNMETIDDESIEFINPFLPLDNKENMKKVFYRHFKQYGHTKKEIYDAIESGYKELENYKKDVQNKGEEVVKYIEDNDMEAIVLSGRPYHIDPEINHGIPSMICGYNIAVLSEDSVNHLKVVKRPLRVVDQWTYHSRLYDAASYVATNDRLEMVQLNSFGCGLDAVTSDQVNDLLKVSNKSITLLKIDEINNLGASRIRIRSLIAVMNSKKNLTSNIRSNYVSKTVEFTKDMKKTHTILCPQMSPIHFDILKEAFISSGFNFELLDETTTEHINEGLRVVNNDACYPSIMVVGQLISALKSGKYDLNNTSVLMSQTGGGCRATNYIGFIRKALNDSNLGDIPVISLNAGGLEKNSGFKIDMSIMKKLSMAVIYGDLLMKVLYKVRPYEKVKGSANELFEKYNTMCKNSIARASYREFVSNIREIIKAFDVLETIDVVKPKVGIVGEILVKYHPRANNHIIEHLENEGAEVVVPDLADFFLYGGYNATIRHEMLSTSFIKKLGGDMVIGYIEFYRKEMKKALEKSVRFEAPKPIQTLAKGAAKVVSLGHQTGEGWFLTAEIIELLESGVNNIACLQPFACLPNHITGKGVIKELKKHFPLANIAPIDFDPGASEVNQINRIKLMLATANKNI
ncbi:MAG: acyl-CoA dehydratase activase-related protein, partial [Acidaminobacteraceae bacterium]